MKEKNTNKAAIIGSETLPLLRDFSAYLSHTTGYFEFLPQLRLIVDSNIILEEITYLARIRGDSPLQTSFQEIIQSGTIIAYAPHQLKIEVEKHIPRVARQQKVNEELVWKEWANYTAYIHFYTPRDIDAVSVTESGDIDDRAFVALYSEIGARAIYSKDRHISNMGASTISSLDVMINFRTYARSKSIEVGIVAGGVIIAGTGVGGTIGLAHLSSLLFAQFRKLPTWLQIGLAIGGIGSLIIPKTRNAIKDYLQSSLDSIKSTTKEIEPFIAEIVSEYETNKVIAEHSWDSIQQSLPKPSKRIPLRKILHAIFISERHPLSLEQIEKKVFLHGYKSKAKNFPTYIKRILQQEEQFTCNGRDQWSIAKP